MKKPSSRPQRPNFSDMAKAFGAVDAMLDKLKDGWIHDIQGNAVFKNPADGTWYDIPAALEGWVALWERIDHHHDLMLELKPMKDIVARLRYGAPIPPDMVAKCQTVVDQCKRAYRRMDLYEIGRLVKTQLIANKVEELGLVEEERK